MTLTELRAWKKRLDKAYKINQRQAINLLKEGKSPCNDKVLNLLNQTEAEEDQFKAALIEYHKQMLQGKSIYFDEDVGTITGGIPLEYDN